MEYTKPWLSFEQQADFLIKERGLIADRNELIERLSDTGYYRLSGYWYIFKRKPIADDEGPKDERFVEGTTLEEIWSLYVFDRQFRLVVLDAIERVEVYFRTRLAYELAGSTEAFGFLDRKTCRVSSGATILTLCKGAPTNSTVRASPLRCTSRKSTAMRMICRHTGF